MQNQNIENIFVEDIGGITDGAQFADITKRPDYNQFDTIVYVRDSEYPENYNEDKFKHMLIDQVELNHYQGVIRRIKKRFQSIDLKAPDAPFLLSGTDGKKCGYIILTTNVNADENGVPVAYVGTLEDLCMSIAVDTDSVEDGRSAIDLVNQMRNNKLRGHRHKRLFHSSLAFNSDVEVIGALTGQAVRRGAFDLNHDNFKPIAEFLKEINNS
jgi:hypothetical protein